jgi:hypothetical protein
MLPPSDVNQADHHVKAVALPRAVRAEQSTTSPP